MAAIPPTYSRPIQSLSASNAGLPPVLGNMDLNRQIIAGQAIDPQNLSHAKFIAKALRVSHDHGPADPHITTAVVESAELRASAIEAAHVVATYPPAGNIAPGLQPIMDLMNTRFNAIDQRFTAIEGRLDGIEGRLDGIDGRLNGIDGRLNGIDGRLDGIDGRLNGMDQHIEQVLAIAHNSAIRAANSRRDVPSLYAPLHKTVPGSGVHLAEHIFGIALVQQNHVANNPIPAVGALPNLHNILAYTRGDVIRLIIFYNENFGINHGNSLPECIEKISKCHVAQY